MVAQTIGTSDTAVPTLDCIYSHGDDDHDDHDTVDDYEDGDDDDDDDDDDFD